MAQFQSERVHKSLSKFVDNNPRIRLGTDLESIVILRSGTASGDSTLPVVLSSTEAYLTASSCQKIGGVRSKSDSPNDAPQLALRAVSICHQFVDYTFHHTCTIVAHTYVGE